MTSDGTTPAHRPPVVEHAAASGGVTFAFENGGRIESVEGFLAAARTFGLQSSDCYFRGEPHPGDGLRPSIGRPQAFAGVRTTFSPQQERRMLHRFRRHAYSHFQRTPTEWETLFLARHHGLPTRLLDWTANPLVALYFAAVYDSEERMHRPDARRERRSLGADGTVWAIQARSREVYDVDVFDDHVSPLDVRGIKLIHPFHPTPRMTAQSGVFTLHSDPRTDVVRSAGRRYLDDELDIARLARWTLARDGKSDVILDLQRMAIDSRTLFPDFEGLARGLWQQEVIDSRRR